MILLLSTANNLYWLGRYMRRTQELPPRVIHCPQEERAELIKYLGWPLEQTDDARMRDYLDKTAMPALFEQVNDNVQAVKGVIDGDAAELFNQMRRLHQAASPRAACFQVYACSAVMLKQNEYVTLFWQLGDYIEMLHNRIRLKQVESRHYRYLADVVTRLPVGTEWDHIKQEVQAMVYTVDSNQFYQWHNKLTQLFEDGV